MPNVKIYDMTGKEVGEMSLSEKVFGRDATAETAKAVLHTAVRAFLMNQRQGTQSALTRTEVSGGGKKPWKQKGTGRARQGSTRAPQWTHGGVVFAPKPREHRVTINKQTRRVALFTALSDKVASGKLIVVDTIAATEYKTKTMVQMLNALNAGRKSMVVLADNEPMTVKSLANIEGVKTALTNTINVYDILNADTLVVAKAAIEKIEEVYA